VVCITETQAYTSLLRKQLIFFYTLVLILLLYVVGLFVKRKEHRLRIILKWTLENNVRL
jgi:hypothetical protein